MLKELARAHNLQERAKAIFPGVVAVTVHPALGNDKKEVAPLGSFQRDSYASDESSNQLQDFIVLCLKAVRQEVAHVDDKPFLGSQISLEL